MALPRAEDVMETTAPHIPKNFWIEAAAEGKTRRVRTGPKTKDGGFTANVYQRDQGKVRLVAMLKGEARPGIGLVLTIETDEGVVATIRTKR